MAGNSKGELGRAACAPNSTRRAVGSRSGAATVIAHGRLPEVSLRIAAGKTVGTLLRPASETMCRAQTLDRRQLQIRRSLRLDAGAVRVLREQGRSLLPVGVRGVEGEFDRGDLVASHGRRRPRDRARIANYNAGEARRIAGAPSAEFAHRRDTPAKPN